MNMNVYNICLKTKSLHMLMDFTVNIIQEAMDKFSFNEYQRDT